MQTWADNSFHFEKKVTYADIAWLYGEISTVIKCLSTFNPLPFKL